MIECQIADQRKVGVTTLAVYDLPVQFDLLWLNFSRANHSQNRMTFQQLLSLVLLIFFSTNFLYRSLFLRKADPLELSVSILLDQLSDLILMN